MNGLFLLHNTLERRRVRKRERQRRRYLRRITLALACVATSPAFGQAGFRRGDVNADGVVDIGDAWCTFQFVDPIRPTCDEARDTNDDGAVNITDHVSLLGYLFLGRPEPAPPGPHTPGPDPTEGGFSCRSYEPVSRQPTGEFRLGFECPVDFVESPGQPPRAEVYGTLQSLVDPLSSRRANGWSISVGLEGQGTEIVEATIDDTVAEPFPKGLLTGGFHVTEIVDPSALVGGAGAQGPGVVSAVVLSFAQSVFLEAEGVERIVKIALEARDDVPDGRLFYVDGKRGSGQPVDNVILVGCEAADAELGSCDEFRLVEPVELQIPGDCNQDGQLDLSDPVCFLGHLFLGAPELLPCGDGSPRATGNVNLLDWHGDGNLDITDAVGALRWLTQGGRRHVLADVRDPSACRPIRGCLLAPACGER